MTKASTGTRRASTARAAAKVAKRALQRERVQSSAGTRREGEKPTDFDGLVFGMQIALDDALSNERHRTYQETRYWCARWRSLALSAVSQLVLRGR